MSSPGIAADTGLSEPELARIDGTLRELVATGFTPWPRVSEDEPLWLCRWWTGGYADLVVLDSPHVATLLRLADADPCRPQQLARTATLPRNGDPGTVLEAALRLDPPTANSCRLSVRRSSNWARPIFAEAIASGEVVETKA
jgi:hypothetical protein